METKLFGVPLVFWGAVCLALTIVRVMVWPSDKAVNATTIRYFILRWFHALVWLLLALAAFIAAFSGSRDSSIARFVAFLSLITYLIFMFTFVTSQ